MVPGRLACSNVGAAATPASRCRVGEGPELSQRKSATTAGVPTEHPSRVFPATPCRPQPRFFHRHGPHRARTWTLPTRPVLWARAAALWAIRWQAVGGWWRGHAWSASAWSWCSEWSSFFLLWSSALARLRAERVGAAGAVAETRSGGGPWPPARAARRRRAALIQ